MLLPPSTRSAIQDTLKLTRQIYSAINLVLVEPVACTTCGYEPFTDGAKAIPCPVCGGTGEIPTYVIQRIKARWTFVQLSALDPYRGIPPGVESGDLLIWVSPRDEPAVLQAYRTKDSYLEIEGNTFTIGGYNPDGVGNPDEYCFIGKKRKPTHNYAQV